jgi:hypothetical protein
LFLRGSLRSPRLQFATAVLRFGEPPGSIDFGLPPVEQGVYRGTIRVKVKQIIDT